MYTEAAIEELEKRIAWKQEDGNDEPVALDETSKTGQSGRHFESFHALAAIGNLYASVATINMDAEAFNTFLQDLRKQAVLAVLPLIMDKSNGYDEKVGYDDMIISNIRLFDDAIGYKCAMMCLELFISTTRKNLVERNAKLAVQNLKLELYGYKNDNGHQVATGLRHELDKAVRKASAKLFPVVPTVSSKSIW